MESAAPVNGWKRKMERMLDRGDGNRLAFALEQGRGPGLMFLPGYQSDMNGSKALALEAHARVRGQAMLRFDYSGHGASEGRFEEGSIGRWRADTLAVLDQLADGPQILVGSSMGGWLALLAALARPERVAGLLLLAPAPDFTRWGMTAGLTPQEGAEMDNYGLIRRPSPHGPDGLCITRHLLVEAEAHILMDRPIPLAMPARILQGQRDPDVPWKRALMLAEKLESADVHLTLIKDGDHRLSRPQDLALLLAEADALSGW
jgi:pimeloyl-ACP methyl ester carboxylesterase